MTYTEFLNAIIDTVSDESLKEKARELQQAEAKRKAQANANRAKKNSSKYEPIDAKTLEAITANPHATASKIAEIIGGTTSGATASAKRLTDAGKVERVQVANGSRLVWAYTAKA